MGTLCAQAHKEIEVKFSITELEYTNLLAMLSAQYSGVLLDQNDYVVKMKSGDNVRVRVEKDRALLTHKKRIYDKEGIFLYCQESECVIDGKHIQEIEAILRGIGLVAMNPDLCGDVIKFKDWLQDSLVPEMAYRVHIHKKRMEFAAQDYTYVLDWVENLGYFLEIEHLVPLDDTTDEICLRGVLRAKLLDLGLSDRDPIIHGYTVLMHEKGCNK